MLKNIRPRFYYGYVVVTASFVIGSLAWGSQRTFGVFLQPLLTQFEWTRASASLTITVQSLITGILSIPAGRLSDRFGPRVVLTICGISIGTGFILSYFVNSLWQLYLTQGILVGVGLAGVMVPLTSTVIRWFTGRAGLMNGIVHAGLGLGITAIPPLATWLIVTYDWRFAYLLLGISILLIVTGSSQLIRLPQSDFVQPATSEHVPSRLKANVRNYSFREAMGTLSFWMLSLLFFADVFNINTVMVHIVQNAKDLKIPAVQAVSILSVTAALSVIGRIGAGALADNKGIKWTIFIGMSATLFSFIWILFAKSILSFYVFAVAFGIGGWAVGAVLSPLVAEYFGFKSHGLILGIITFIGTLGGALGPLVAGRVFDTIGNYKPAFIICALMSTTGLILLKFLNKPGEENNGHASSANTK